MDVRPRIPSEETASELLSSKAPTSLGPQDQKIDTVSTPTIKNTNVATSKLKISDKNIKKFFTAIGKKVESLFEKVKVHEMRKSYAPTPSGRTREKAGTKFQQLFDSVKEGYEDEVLKIEPKTKKITYSPNTQTRLEISKDKEIKLNGNTCSEAELSAILSALEQIQDFITHPGDKDGATVSKNAFSAVLKENTIRQLQEQSERIKRNFSRPFNSPSRIPNFQSYCNDIKAVENSYNSSSLSPQDLIVIAHDINSLKTTAKLKAISLLNERREQIKNLLSQPGRPDMIKDLKSVLGQIQTISDSLGEISTGSSKIVFALSELASKIDELEAENVKTILKTEEAILPGDSSWHVLARGRDGLQGEDVADIIPYLGDPNSGHHPLLKPNEEGLNPLHVAAQHMNLAFFSAFFAPFAMDISVKDTNNGPNGKSPVHILVENFAKQQLLQADPETPSRICLMLYFIANSCPDMLTLKDDNDRTPLQLAEQLIQNNIPIPSEALYYLKHAQDAHNRLQGFEQNARDETRAISSMIESLKQGKIAPKDIAEHKTKISQALTTLEEKGSISYRGTTVDLLEKKKQREKAPDSNGNTHWHALAAKKEERPNYFVDWLTKRDQAELTKQNKQGDTPIHTAIKSGNASFIKVLCDPAHKYPIANWEEASLKDNPPLLEALTQLVNAKTPEESSLFSEMALLLAGDNPQVLDNEKIKDFIKKNSSDQKVKELLEKLPSLGFERQLEKSRQAYYDRQYDLLKKTFDAIPKST
jgi:ankyrin repeat protein